MVNQVVKLYPIGSAVCEIADSDVGGSKVQSVLFMFELMILGCRA